MIDFLKELFGENFNEEQAQIFQKKLQENYVLKSEMENFQGDFDKRLKQSKIDFFINQTLQNCGAKNQKAVLALIDKEKVDLGQQGEILGLLEQIEGLKKTDGFLFEEIKGLNPVEKSETTDKVPQKMGYDELCKFLEENPNTKLK